MKILDRTYFYTGEHFSIVKCRQSSSALFVMFSILTQLQWKTILVYSEDKKNLVTKTKGDEDVIKLDFDFSDFEGKFYRWHVFGQAMIWNLTNEETAILKICCNTAYYYYVVQRHGVISERQYEDLAALFTAIFEVKLSS